MGFRHVFILLLLGLFFIANVHADYVFGCDQACKNAGYKIGWCSVFLSGCGSHGWEHVDAGGACGLGTICCCSNLYESLDATGMCDWYVNGNVHGSGLFGPFTCDSNFELVNYYCEDNNLKIECKDCWGFPNFLCGQKKVITIVYGSDLGQGYKCAVSGTTGVCNTTEKVPQGTSDVWGYDAVPYCGNNKVDQANEECDGDDLANKTCADLGFSNNNLPRCKSDCTFDTNPCLEGGIPENCGNGVIDAGEECDGSDFGGKTCADYGGDASKLPVCTPNCRIDASLCNVNVTGDACSPPGDERCDGLALQICQDGNSDGYVEWVTIEDPSPECCVDGDCSAVSCASQNGDWLPGAPDVDYSLQGYCCGDDRDEDLGMVKDEKLCILDNDYKWVAGEEGRRYADNRILFCNGEFHICFNQGAYTSLAVADHCDMMCGYYCEPRFDKWLNATDPEGISVLSEPLSNGELIDSKKYDLAGTYGCCPGVWCWNGSQCIEDQSDEPDNFYVYQHPSTAQSFRCIDGAWQNAKLVYNWDYTLKGYCPQADEQCLVSYESYENDNKPEMYFSNEKPQCIASGQYILDYFCHGSEWISRTAILAAKMVGLANSNFTLFCDEPATALNDVSYLVLGKHVIEYIGSNCEINGYNVSCTNNFCVLKEQGKVYVGTTLNVELFSDNGIAPVFNITECEASVENDTWSYTQCGVNAIYNSNISALIYSKTGVSDSPLDGWAMLQSLFVEPTDLISEMIANGVISFETATGLGLSLGIVNQSKLFNRVYLLDEGNEKALALFEPAKLELSTECMKYLLMAKYSGFSADICAEVNNYTTSLGKYNCVRHTDDYIVVDSREVPSYLLERWTDLSSKFQK